MACLALCLASRINFALHSVRIGRAIATSATLIRLALIICFVLIALPTAARAAASGFSFAFSPDSTRLVTFDSYAYLDTSSTKPAINSDTTACLWDAHTGKRIATLQGHTSALSSAAFSPDGTRIVTASQDTTARLWNGRTGVLLATLRGSKYALQNAAFSHDGERIVTVSSDDNARLWDGHTGKLVTTLEGQGGIASCAAFSPDGTRLVTGGEDAVCLWDGRSGALLTQLTGKHSQATHILFSPDGTRIAVISSGFTPACLWDGHTGKVSAKLSSGTGGSIDDMLNVNAMVFSPDSSRLVIAALEGTRLWDGHTGKMVAAPQKAVPLGGYPTGIALFSKDSTRLVTYNIDRSVALWDGHTGARMASLQEASPAAKEGPMDGAISMALSPDRTRLITLDTTSAYLRDGQSGMLIVQLPVASIPDSQTSVYPSVLFSPDGMRFITSSNDRNNGRLWDGHTGKLIATLMGNRRAEVSKAR